MPDWYYVSRFKGYHTSNIIPIYLDADGAVSKIEWDATTPTNTRVTMDVDVSFNDGLEWVGWKTVENGSSIPQILPNTPLRKALIKYRATLFSTEPNKTPVLKSVAFEFEPVLVIDNKGDDYLKPELWIAKIENGDLSIINLSNNNAEFKFENLLDEETIYVNNDKEQIETSLGATYRYSSFNDRYLELPVGTNVLRINGNAQLKFRYQYKLKQG